MLQEFSLILKKSVAVTFSSLLRVIYRHKITGIYQDE
jgi:hypothetical protein